MTEIDASHQQVADTAAVLGRAALFDQRFSKPDPGKTAAWAEALAPYRFELPDMLHAVTGHYSDDPERSLMPADVIRRAKTLRREHAEREDRQAREDREDHRDRHLGLVPPDRQLGGLPIGGADGDPVPGAYRVNDAVDRPCATCGAEPDCPCTNPITDGPRKLPCLSRLKPPRPESDPA